MVVACARFFISNLVFHFNFLRESCRLFRFLSCRNCTTSEITFFRTHAKNYFRQHFFFAFARELHLTGAQRTHTLALDEFLLTNRKTEFSRLQRTICGYHVTVMWLLIFFSFSSSNCFFLSLSHFFCSFFSGENTSPLSYTCRLFGSGKR